MSDARFATILRAARRHPLWEPTAETRNVSYGREVIEHTLPHRGSILMLDEIVALDLELRAIRARRVLAPDDRGFAGHFPGDPVYPAFLQFEILGQAGICLLDFIQRASTEPSLGTPRPVRLIRAFDARLLAEVRPGDQVSALAQVVEHDELTSIFAAQLLRGETICAAVILEVCFLDS